MNNRKKIRAIISGGGTGGHIFPAVAIANELMHQNAANEILFVGALGRMEMERVPQAGYKIVGLPIAGLNRAHLLKNISLPFKLIKSYFKSKQILKEFKPDVVIGVGGYASFTIMKAAQAQGIPTLIQEQNSHAGKSNQNLAKKAKAICVAYENMDRFFTGSNVILTGNPVRSLITDSKIDKASALAHFNLNNEKPVVLIIGGSLGAKAINDTLIAQVDKFIQEDVQVIWQTGKLSFAAAQNAVKGKEKSIKVMEFISEMDKAYAAADVVISRAGALSIAEIAIVAKPAVLVPLPTAAEDHQTVNAMSLVNKQAALLVKNADTDEALLSTTFNLIKDKAQCETISKNLVQLAITNADERIVNEIYKILP
jgi:UDP-N-acetylglucosamine--N-acetylmuramyl-(pentapeptide) pyrophosphoryl-undecaprenol N-acetylglucosamine transferase